MAPSCLILFFLFCCISSGEGYGFQNYIIGSTGASIEEYPYQISFRVIKTNEHVCGGAIITKKFVITAAHCIAAKPMQEYYIFVGSTSLSGKGAKYKIETGIIHKSYSTTTKHNDIGLIIIKDRFTYRKGVQPIKILMQELPAGTPLTITGWGIRSWPYLDRSESIPDELQMGEIPILSHEECMEATEGLVSQSEICVVDYTKHVATCRGDSGGPVVYANMLVGIVAFGIPCGTGFPDVNTKIYHYIAWITANIKNYCQKHYCTFEEMYPTFFKGL